MKQLGRKIARLFQKQAGFGLLEALVAIGILGLIGVGVIAALDTNSRANRTLDEKVTAVSLATAHLEVIRELTYDDTGDSYLNAGASITIPSQYNVDISTEWSSDGEIFVPYNTEDATLQRITVSVSREGGRPVLLMCTYKKDF